MSFAQPFSNYEILDRIGSGAMGTVFKARQKHMNRIVALKVLKPMLARDTRYVDRLKREAQIVGQLNHPNIVTGFDLGAEGGYHFFVMEFVEGRSLKELLEEWGAFTEDRVLEVGIQIARALEHALEVGIIHRDIKPANVLIDERNHVKLTDMGLAKVATDLTLTREGATVGTPQYISPEQAKNPRSVDVRSDLYSLGATLFHMATGQAPFRAESIGELISKVLHERAPSAIRLNPVLTDGLSLVIRKLLAKDPDLRYQSPTDLLRDLERVQRSEQPKVDPRELEKDQATRRRRSVPRSLRGPVVVGLLGILVGASSTWALLGLRDRDRESVGVEPEFDAATKLGERLQTARIEFERALARDPSGRSAAVWNAERLAALRQIDRAARARLRELEGVDAASVQASVARLDAPSAEHLAFEVLAREIGEPLGIEPRELGDDELQRQLRTPIERFVAFVGSLWAAESEAFEQRFEQYLREVERAVDELAHDGRFLVARRRLERSLDDFFDEEERVRGLDRHRLPDELLAVVEARRAELTSEVQARLAGLEQRAVDRLERAGESVGMASRAALRSVVDGHTTVEHARETIGSLHRDLSRFHPPPAELSPRGKELWRTLEQQRRDVLRELLVEESVLVAVRTERLRDLVYELLPFRGPGVLLMWLDARIPADDPSVRVDRELLAAAASVAERVQAAATPRSDGLRVFEPAGGASVVVAPLGNERRWTNVPFADLIRDVDGPLGLSPREMLLGTAFWSLVQGRRTEALERLSDAAPEVAIVVADRIAERLLDLDARSTSGFDRGARLAELFEAFNGRELERAERLRPALGEPRDAGEVELLGSVDRWLGRARRIEARLAELRAELPADVAEVEGVGLRAAIRPDALAADGYRLDGEVLERVAGATATFAEARRYPMVVAGPTSIDLDGTTIVRFEFSLDELPGEASLLLEAQGASFALGCFGSDWSLVVAELAPGALASESTVRSGLQTALVGLFDESRAHLLPGAFHRVEIARNGDEVALSLDGEVVARSTAESSDGQRRRLKITALGDFRFRRVVWSVPIPD